MTTVRELIAWKNRQRSLGERPKLGDAVVWTPEVPEDLQAPEPDTDPLMDDILRSVQAMKPNKYSGSE